MGIILNDQQQECMDNAIKWFKSLDSKQTFEISGPAGSGKTTIVKSIIKGLGLSIENVLFVAYVGKAALQLTRSGVNGKTIHSSFYDIHFEIRKDDKGNPIIRNGKTIKAPKFVLKESLPPYIKLIVIDEGPMVNETFADDIESFGIPVIVLGDLQQLPPVIGSTRYLKKPDYVITKIMRQKEGDPIIYLSQLAARGQKIPYGRYGNKCFVIPENMVNDNMLKGADMILTPRNSHRVALNKRVREEIYGYTSKLPNVGEKLICRQNNRGRIIGDNITLVNGMVGYVDKVEKASFNGKTLDIDFRPEFEQNNRFNNVTLDYNILRNSIQIDNDENVAKKGFSYMDVFEYGYALTVHLSQGSQAENVLFFNHEPFGDLENRSRLLYTGITRATEGLILVQ